MPEIAFPTRTYEITKLTHGYLVTPSHYAAGEMPRQHYHAFETLEHAIDFVRGEFQKQEQEPQA